MTDWVIQYWPKGYAALIYVGPKNPPKITETFSDEYIRMMPQGS